MLGAYLDSICEDGVIKHRLLICVNFFKIIELSKCRKITVPSNNFLIKVASVRPYGHYNAICSRGVEKYPHSFLIQVLDEGER